MGKHDTPIFPRRTIAWKQVQNLSAWRKISISLVAMAVLTGVVLRLFRSLVLTNGPAESVLYLAAAVAVGAIVLLGALTLHVSNFTIRHWWWRAPLFGIVEFAAEMLTSYVLIMLGREPWGATGRAGMEDFTRVASETFLWRMIPICAFALFLAVIVHAIRSVLAKREDSRDPPPVTIPEPPPVTIQEP